MNIDRNAPVGVFDSGIGGLTVAREIMRNLPSEKIVYFGDTARVPYGSKSRETVIRYSRQIIHFLQEQKVKAIVKQWLLFIAEYETLPNDIIALNFNLWEAVEENGQSCYTLELTGSKQYDAENDDWACEEDFDPRERNCDALQLSSEIPWEEVLNGLVEVLKELKKELKVISLFQVKHITVGFAEGDLIVIK